MVKRKVLIAIHQLNLGGAQKALISALNAIDYSENDVTLYVRKARLDLLPLINKNVSKIIINEDPNKYDHKPYALCLEILSRVCIALHKDHSHLDEKAREYILRKQFKYEKKHYFSNSESYDIVVSYIQGYTAAFVAENVNARKKVMFYHDSTDSLHELHNEVMEYFDKIYCVSKGAQKAVQGFYPQFAEKIECLENYVDAEKVRAEAEKLTPDYPNDKLILCSCGRITPVKGFDLAVGAADILRTKGLDFKWYFVGDGVDRPKIEALIAEKNLQDYIEITGLQDNPYPYIKHCDIYVQPSYEEAHSLSIIEAQILCKPIVSTATVGGVSIINDGLTGMISRIDSQSITYKVYQLINDDVLKEKIKSELQKIDYQDDYKRFCGQWRELLDQ